MIRYEIYSNVASSDHGLQRFPALEDLTHTLDIREIDTRFVRQVFREEEQINLASGKHARGVTVRSTTVREVPVESNIKGCLRWLRAVAARADRGLHVEIENVRATNGAPLVFAQIFARGQKVFVSGLKDDDWSRLTALPDFACKELPKAMQANTALRQDYLARASRPTGFMSMVQRLAELGLVDRETLAVLRDILEKRDPALLKNLNEAQIINMGLIHDFVDRYEKLVSQFCDLLVSESALGDLPQMFELMTQGLRFDLLVRMFKDFALPEKQQAIREKRSLVNEIRIGLVRGEETRRDDFRQALLPLVVKARLQQDPKLYLKAHRLPEVEAPILEAMEAPRRMFLTWMKQWGERLRVLPDGAVQAPPEVTQGIFELAVSLVFQSKYAQSYREGAQPAAVIVARNLLSVIVFDQFDLNSIRKLHPNLPPRGVARNLAGKVVVTVDEVRGVMDNLWPVLFPMGPLADELSRFILAKYKSEAAQSQAKEVNRFIQGASAQLTAMNYVLGRSGQTYLIRRAALAAGGMLGLTMLDSRDRIRAREGAAGGEEGGEDEQLAGYQLLMVRDDSRYFPLRARAEQLATAYGHLVDEHVAHSVRRFLSKKLKFLFDLHGQGLFRVILDHLRWQQRLHLSEHQLAEVLLRMGVFDQARLKDFGYTGQGSGGNDATDAGSNPWLAEAFGQGVEGPSRFGNEAAQGEVQAAEGAFKEVVGRYAARAKRAGAQSAQAVMGRLMGSEVLDPRAPACAEALGETGEAGLLTGLLEEIFTQEQARLLAGQETNEAVEVLMPGPLAYLTLIRSHHEFELEHGAVLVRLRPARYLPAPLIDEHSMLVAEKVRTALNDKPELRELRLLMQGLKEHDEVWSRLMAAMAVPLIDQMVQQVVLQRLEPVPPLPAELIKLPEERVLCLSTSSFDQAKFSKIVAHPERRDVYATLSELASWLQRFRRLGEEMEFYREVVSDVMEIIAGLNLSTFDAPYITRYGKMLGALRDLLSIPPEELTPEDLNAIETQARTIGELVREGYDQERSVAMRDRWLSRIAMRLRSMHPNLRLTFVSRLHEQVHPALRSGKDRQVSPEEAQEKAKLEEYQTFSERVRNVIDYRVRLEQKRVIVMSPANTQRQLTLTLLDRLIRIKGVHTPIFVDISGCESFVDQLRARIPPYRLFDLRSL